MAHTPDLTITPVTRCHNIEILGKLGFKQISNTTVFKNQDGNYILSPSVAESTNGSYWFDIREVNLNRMKDLNRMKQNFLLLVRIVPDLFIFEKNQTIKYLLSEELMDNRPNSGNVWGIHIGMGSYRKINIFNIKDRNTIINVKLLDKIKVIKRYDEIR